MNNLSKGFVGLRSKGKQAIDALFLAGKEIPTGVLFAIVAGASTVCEITISVVNKEGYRIAGSHSLDIFLSDAAAGLGLTATAASGAVGVKANTGTELGAMTAKKAFRVVTKSDGTITLSITDAAKTLFYVGASIPAINSLQVSRKLVAGDYGA